MEAAAALGGTAELRPRCTSRASSFMRVSKCVMLRGSAPTGQVQVSLENNVQTTVQAKAHRVFGEAVVAAGAAASRCSSAVRERDDGGTGAAAAAVAIGSGNRAARPSPTQPSVLAETKPNRIVLRNAIGRWAGTWARDGEPRGSSSGVGLPALGLAAARARDDRPAEAHGRQHGQGHRPHPGCTATAPLSEAYVLPRNHRQPSEHGWQPLA